jgi:hypothetical protein
MYGTEQIMFRFLNIENSKKILFLEWNIDMSIKNMEGIINLIQEFIMTIA